MWITIKLIDSNDEVAKIKASVIVKLFLPLDCYMLFLEYYIMLCCVVSSPHHHNTHYQIIAITTFIIIGR